MVPTRRRPSAQGIKCPPVYSGHMQKDQLWLFAELAENSRDFVFRQDGAPPHWNIHVRQYLNDELPHRWIGRIVEDDLALFPWRPQVT
ncbi:hypothetical protein AVEN_158132-1 [Araneus ventricosus]|uniref:Tc1-like transposase DDE domain-containing protein n=1 Tax=Araneus ventricosus TaxID=182803 RepID=A0A4Y2Q5J4_ARAVE|nr:hypothetical protein AVEN_158132-1 [Araneus ventricosus]